MSIVDPLSDMLSPDLVEGTVLGVVIWEIWPSPLSEVKKERKRKRKKREMRMMCQNFCYPRERRRNKPEIFKKLFEKRRKMTRNKSWFRIDARAEEKMEGEKPRETLDVSQNYYFQPSEDASLGYENISSSFFFPNS